jgi:lipopolysaccharide export LptBFGC system permease protein LptF
VLLQLYLLRQLALSVLFAIAGLAVIVLPTVAIQALNKLGAIDMETVARYLPLLVAELVPYLMPMAFLLGVVATFGRLAADRELVAIHMAGLHPVRLLLPGLLVAAPLAYGTDHLLSEFNPDLKYRQRSIMREAGVAQFVAGLEIKNELVFGAHSLQAESNHGGVWRNAVVNHELEEGRPQQIRAAEVRIELQGDLMLLHLKDYVGLTPELNYEGSVATIPFRLSELFKSEPKSRNNPKYLLSSEMGAEIARAELEPEKRAAYSYEIQRRHALAATYFLFLLLGIPTGIALRSSTQLGAFTGALGYAFAYYVLAERLGKVLAATGAVSPLVAAWATNALFLAAGIVFFVRALLR